MSFPKEGVGCTWDQVPSRRYGLQWDRVYPGGIGYLGRVGYTGGRSGIQGEMVGYTQGVVYPTPYPPPHGLEGTAVVGTHPTGVFSSCIVSTLCRTVEMPPYYLGGSISLGSLSDK